MLVDHLKTALSYKQIESREYDATKSTLLISIPYAPANDGLVLLSEGKLYEFAIPGCVGLSIIRNQLWVALSKADHLKILAFEPGKETKTIATCEVGDIHDICFLGEELYAVSTSTNEVVSIDSSGCIVKRWKMPGFGDAWHLNCLDVWDGRLVVSAFGKSPYYRGFKRNLQGEGIVFDLETQEVLLGGFFEPHTPRRDDTGGVYVCNSGMCSLVYRKNGREKEIAFPGAFTRGLAISEHEIFLGLSSLRHRNDRHDHTRAIARAQVAILDRQSLELKGKISLPQAEIYDILVLNNEN